MFDLKVVLNFNFHCNFCRSPIASLLAGNYFFPFTIRREIVDLYNFTIFYSIIIPLPSINKNKFCTYFIIRLASTNFCLLLLHDGNSERTSTLTLFRQLFFSFLSSFSDIFIIQIQIDLERDVLCLKVY